MKIAFIPTRIKTFGKALEVFNSEHKVQNILGLKFRQTFKLNQDMFEQLTRTSPLLRVPENTRILFNGTGQRYTNLEVLKNAKFIGKEASFMDVINSGKKLVLEKVHNVLISENKAVSSVFTAFDTVNKDHSTLRAFKVNGTNHTVDSARSFVWKVAGSNHTKGKGFSAVAVAKENVAEDNAKSIVLSVLEDNSTTGKARTYIESVSGGNYTADDAHSFVSKLNGDNYVRDRSFSKVRTAMKNNYFEDASSSDIKDLRGEALSVEKLHAPEVAKLVGKYSGETLQEFCN